MERTARPSDIHIEKLEDELTPSNSNPHTPGLSDDEWVDIAPIKQDIIAERLKTLEAQRKNLGLFKFAEKKLVAAQIETTHQVATVATQIETAHCGLPLGNEAKEFLLKLSEKHPDAFENLTNFLKPLEPDENPEHRYANATVAIGMDSSLDTDIQNKLKNLFADITMTQTPTNTQFNSDQLTGATPRRESEIKRFEKILTGNTSEERSLPEGQYVTDSDVIAAQRQHVDSAKTWATKNGFENTRWFPSGFSGRGMLFCADWDPIEQLEGGPLKVSRHIGIMLAGRVRMTRVTTEIPGDFSRAKKEEMLAHFSIINSPESEAFVQECESQIHQMHSELTQKIGFEKMVLKEGALKQAAQFIKQLQVDESTKQFIGTLAYLYPGTFKEVVDFANNPDASKEEILASMYKQHENDPSLFHDLQKLILQKRLILGSP